ncbi:MAG: VanW family protein [Clostridia bacterium]|nr:VanW family protein [Clostridia bacterium]
MAKGKFQKTHAAGKHPKALRNTLIILGCTVFAAALVAVGCACGLFGGAKSNKIADNVYIAGVDVGGLTKEEATQKLQSALGEIYTGKSMNVTLLSVPQELFHATIEEVALPTDSILNIASTGAAPEVDVSTLENDPEEMQPEVVEELPEEETEVPVEDEGRLDGKEEFAVLELSEDKAKFAIDISAAVNAAYAVGRKGQAAPKQRLDLDISDYVQCDEAFIRSTLEQAAAEAQSDFVASAVKDGVTTEINVENEDGTIEKKTVDALELTVGAPKRELDVDKLYDLIREAYGKAIFELDYDLVEKYPEVIDLDALMKTYGTEPVNASYDEETFAVTKETLGFGFDRKTVLEQLEQAKPGDIITVPLTDLEPPITEKLLKSVLFSDVLGSYDSPHTADSNRTHNLELACAAINGTIIKPGEVFSFNDIVGERTSAKGYREATAYVSGGDLKQETGGGICQVASTLYISALQAEMEILSRAEHMYMVTYCPCGLDATIYWGSLDFKFRNTSDYPIRIEASVSNGYVHFRIVGTETRDYTVKLDAVCTAYVEPVVDKENQTISGNYCIYKSYIYRYDADGKEISRDYIATSQYMIQHTKDLESQLETESTTEPTESSDPEPTEPTEPEPTEPEPTDPTESEPTEDPPGELTP